MNYNKNDYSIDIAKPNENSIAEPIENSKSSYKSSYSNHQSGNDLENHHLQSNIFYKKYCINNQNDYSIDIAKPIENSLSSYKDYKSLYYVNDSKNHQSDTYFSKYYKYKKKYLNLKNKILIPVGK